MTSISHLKKMTPEFIKLFSSTKPKWLDPASSIYTNRDLELRDIMLVGFDMDYTLAKYHQEPMEQLQYDLTVNYLIHQKNYPAEIKQLKYDPHLIIRGLVVDKRSGILLKLDTHDRVWRAMYGTRLLSYKEAVEIYANQKISLSFPYFTSLDTLFAMPEACLYCNLIDFFEEKCSKGESASPVLPDVNNFGHNPKINTAQLFEDVRNSMDTIHSNGSLKSMILKNLSHYIDDNIDIALTLHKLRSCGKKIFLLTNSNYDYTNAVMRFILESKLPEHTTWQSFFDIIVTDASKPGFFTGNHPFLKYQNENFIEIKEDEFTKNTIYQSGNLVDFEKMAKCRGQQILYVGDHIYGDIVLSKKESLWRTCLIVEELKGEIELSIKYARELNKASKLDAKRLELDTEIGHHRSFIAHFEAALHKVNHSNLDEKQIEKFVKMIHHLRKEIEYLKKCLHRLDKKSFHFQNEIEKNFHPTWGRLFREHNQLSRFGAQVTHYACIYTSDLTNLLQYSPIHVFRAPGDLMSHDMALLSGLQLSKNWHNSKLKETNETQI